MKRVTIFKNGSRRDGKIILVKDTIEQLVQDVCEKLNLESLERVQLYTSSGALIDEVGAMKDDEVLFASTNDQPFILPPEKMNVKNEWITLNVGGRKFTTTRSTLTKNQPDSMLARMFSNDLNDGMTPSPVDESGAFLIDRSPIYFEPIIGYLRHGQLVLDEGVNIRGVLEEARFYGLETLVQVIEDLMEQETNREAKSMCLSRRDVINALIGTTCNAELRFQGVNLSTADLSKLDLRNINFKYANLKGANLSGANLSYCCLERADLSDCNLDGAILHGVKMVCANLEGSSLRGINCEDPMNKVTNMEGINLKGANLDGSQLAGVNLRVATLKNAFLSNCDLRRAILAGADLENCDLSGSDLHEANLRGANLKDAAFELMMTPLHMAQAIGR